MGRRGYTLDSTHRRLGFTLAESMVVIVIVALFVIMAATNLKALILRNSFKGQVQDFVSALETAATSASQSDKRYEVIIGITEQGYILREISTPDLTQVLEEEIIAVSDFSANCTVSYVMFDDGEFANEGRAKFRAGHNGWEFGGVVVFVDDEGQVYSVVVNRLSNIVAVETGEAKMLWPKTSEELAF
jgi:prepilin-type N-terminal cleavage/methylation domain-containing protein